MITIVIVIVLGFWCLVCSSVLKKGLDVVLVGVIHCLRSKNCGSYLEGQLVACGPKLCSTLCFFLVVISSSVSNACARFCAFLAGMIRSLRSKTVDFVHLVLDFAFFVVVMCILHCDPKLCSILSNTALDLALFRRGLQIVVLALAHRFGTVGARHKPIRPLGS